MSVSQVAEAAAVSAATVVRFCKTIGFGGYNDFRFTLARELGELREPDPDAVGPEDDIATVADKVFRMDIKAIGETLQMLDRNALRGAVEVLEQARNVQVFGTGSSVPVVFDAYYRLSCLGLRVAAVTDTFMQTVGATSLTDHDVALVVSHTGRTEASLTVAQQAQRQGATVVGITSSLNSPLAEIADVALVAATGETTFRTGTMASRIAQISVIDAVYVALANRQFVQAGERLEFVNSLLEARRSPA